MPFRLSTLKWSKILPVVALLSVAGLVLAFTLIQRHEELAPAADVLAEFRKTGPGQVHFREAGSLEPGLGDLKALACGPGGRIFVAGGRKVAVYSDQAKLGEFALERPVTCLAAGFDGRLYAGAGNRVTVCGIDGTNRQEWPAWEESSVLTSIAAGRDDIWVADAINKTVLQYTPDGRLQGWMGGAEPRPGAPRFLVPSLYFDLALTGEGLWVVNPGRHRLEFYNRERRQESAWGVASAEPHGFCGCCNPVHIALLPDGGFVTGEKGLPRVKVYGPDGQYLAMVAGPEQFAEGTAGLDLAVDSRGRILVLDPLAGRIRIYVKVA